MKFSVTFQDKDSSARCGLIETHHSKIQTPVFMPVGTQGVIKTIDPKILDDLNAQIVLSNTYHLYLRPGHNLIYRSGSLHNFMNWQNSILTDSGGFQVFSLARLNNISDDGVKFQSHLDGSSHFFNPELSMEIQQHLGSDIIMAFDECPSGKANKSDVQNAVERTALWINRCQKYLENNKFLYDWNQTLFPIVQGGIYSDLRKESTQKLMPFSSCGMAIGGLAVGEEKSAMLDTVSLMDELLPKRQPRYLMGVGRPTDLVRSVRNGMDMFDCVLPTRNARNGQFFTSKGIINIGNKLHKESFKSLDQNCHCYTCKNFTLAYLRHLYNIKEMLAFRLGTIHNLTYYMSVMKTIRKKIESGVFSSWSNEYLNQMDSYKGM